MMIRKRLEGIVELGKRGVKTGLVIGGCLLGSLSIYGKADALTINGTPVTTAPGNQRYPTTSNENTVWEDYRNGGNKDIYGLINGSEIPIATQSNQERLPRIDHEKVLYSFYGNGWDIKEYNIGTGATTYLVSDVSDQAEANFDSDMGFIFWKAVDTYGYAVWKLNISTGVREKLIPSEPGINKILPVVDNGLIVYGAGWSSFSTRVRSLITGQDIQISSGSNFNEGYEIPPYDVDFGKVVFSEGGNIKLYEDSTGQISLVTNDAYTQLNPRVSDGWVVYQDNRNGNWDIYAKNLATGEVIQVTDNIFDQINPDIDSGVVVWEDYRNGDADIYSTRIVTFVSITDPSRDICFNGGYGTCFDGIDNDGDGDMDWGDKPDCYTRGRFDPYKDEGMGNCCDEDDNDIDGVVDGWDPDCIGESGEFDVYRDETKVTESVSLPLRGSGLVGILVGLLGARRLRKRR